MGYGLVGALVVWGTGLVIVIATRNPKGYEYGLSPAAQHSVGNLAGAVSFLLGFFVA
jgi:hypothetical protein